MIPSAIIKYIFLIKFSERDLGMPNNFEILLPWWNETILNIKYVAAERLIKIIETWKIFIVGLVQ